MDVHDAICAAEQSYVTVLKKGERIDESRWFKGIIFFGKLKLVSLPPGRASEAEKVRRSTLLLTVDNPTMDMTMDLPKPRKSCRIATELESAFEKVRNKIE